MEEIYSEGDLMQDIGTPWGQWKFSLSNEAIDRKLASLPKSTVDKKGCEHWRKLFSVLREPPGIGVSAPPECPDSSSECPMSVEVQEEERCDEDSCIEELTISLVDLCNQVAPRLKHGLNNVREEMKSISEDMSRLRDDSLTSVMTNAWSQLSSDVSKLCYCIPFTCNSQMCKKLCEIITIPWFGKNPPSKIEQLSAILCAEGETACLHLVAPLLQTKDSILARDIFTLEELMAFMVEKHWTALLREVLKELRELQQWQIPSLAMIVEHSEPATDEVHLVIQLMSSSGTNFAMSRDFGALLVAVAKRLRKCDAGFVTQLKLVVNNYKGPLKFKAIKILDDFENL